MAKNKKVIKEQKKYQNLQERYEEMNDYLLDLIEDHRCAEEDLRYLNDFIHYKKLDEEFKARLSYNVHKVTYIMDLLDLRQTLGVQ